MLNVLTSLGLHHNAQKCTETCWSQWSVSRIITYTYAIQEIPMLNIAVDFECSQ